MIRSPDVRALDVAALCRDGARIEGLLPMSALLRLGASVLADADRAGADVAWSAQGSTRAPHAAAPELWLALHASVPVRLDCQRCLQPLTLTLQADRRLRFVRGEQEAARLDEETEDDVLALEPRLDLAALIEDELILALPLVPRHDACPQPLAAPAAADPVQAEAETAPHPFAALAKWRGRDS